MGPNRARSPARGPGLFYSSFLLENSQQAFRKAQQAPSGRWPLISGREQHPKQGQVQTGPGAQPGVQVGP